MVTEEMLLPPPAAARAQFPCILVIVDVDDMNRPRDGKPIG